MKKDIQWAKGEIEQMETRACDNLDYETSVGNTVSANYFDVRRIAFGQVNNLLSNVDTKHTRTIEVPEFVDEWFKSNPPQSWWKKIAEWENEVSDEDRKVVDWYQDYNEDDFIIAWITGDYTVVEERLYMVAKDHENGDWTYVSDGRHPFVTEHKSRAERLADLLGGRVVEENKD